MENVFTFLPDILFGLPVTTADGDDGGAREQMALTRTHFKFGEEETDWTTDYRSGFQFDKEKVR